MKWYSGDKVDDVVAPRDQCTLSRFPSQESWKQWGSYAVDGFDSLDESSTVGNCIADEGDFSCKTMMGELLEMDCLVGEGDQSEISGVRGGISGSSNCWTTLLNYQDYQLDGFPRTNQTNENFLNSLLVDDLCASDQFHLYDSPKSQGTYSMTNNITTDLLLESHDMGSYEQMNSQGFAYSYDWEKLQYGASHHNLPNMLDSGVRQYNAPLGNISQQVCASRRVGDHPSVEETVLQEFGSAMQKMTDKTRLCFRDALYRLARNSKLNLSVQGEHVVSEKPVLIEQTLRSTEKDASEFRSNTIDRAIADLMFNKMYQHGKLSSTTEPGYGYALKQQP